MDPEPPAHGNRHRAWLEACMRAGSAPFPLAEGWGIKFVDLGPGRAAVELDVGPGHCNPQGVVHGGVLFLMLDTALGFAATSTLEGPTRTGTVQVNANFVRPVTQGRLRAEGRVAHRGRSLMHVEAALLDADGQVVARCMGVASVAPDADAAPARA